MSDGFSFFAKAGLFFTDTLLPILLLFTGIFLTFRLRFVQLRFLGQGLKHTFSGIKKKDKAEGISPFAALATSLAAQLGTGNIVGAGSAIILGGPGAVFWMWVSAFFGMSVAYSEASASIFTRRRTEQGGNTRRGGILHRIRISREGGQISFLIIFPVFRRGSRLYGCCSSVKFHFRCTE